MPELVIIQPLQPVAYKVLEGRTDVSLHILRKVSPEIIAANIADADALTVRTAPLPPEALDAATRLRVISRHGVGYDNIPVDYCTKRRIAVTITADANSVSVAEHAMFLMLAAARNANLMDSAVRDSNFDARSDHLGLELSGRTLLIVGFGRIGRQLAARAQAFGMRVIVYDPFVAETRQEHVEIVADLNAGLAQADVLSMHVPLTDATRGLIGARELDLLRDRAIVINASRGGLIDERTLLERIRSGKLHGAGIDTFETEPPAEDSPLLGDRRIVLSPHSAALTLESLDAMGRQSVQNALDGIDGTLRREVVVNPEVLD